MNLLKVIFIGDIFGEGKPHGGKIVKKKEATHVPADECEQVNRLLGNPLKQFHRFGNFSKLAILQENSCLGWAVEFVRETKDNLSLRESGCISVCMTLVNYITCGLKHSRKVERLTW